MNEQTNTCPISSNLFINPNFFGFYYFQIIWKYNTETRCREQKAKGDENNTAVPFSMTRKKKHRILLIQSYLVGLPGHYLDVACESLPRWEL